MHIPAKKWSSEIGLKYLQEEFEKAFRRSGVINRNYNNMFFLAKYEANLDHVVFAYYNVQTTYAFYKVLYYLKCQR